MRASFVIIPSRGAATWPATPEAELTRAAHTAVWNDAFCYNGVLDTAGLAAELAFIRAAFDNDAPGLTALARPTIAWQLALDAGVLAAAEAARSGAPLPERELFDATVACVRDRAAAALLQLPDVLAVDVVEPARRRTLLATDSRDQVLAGSAGAGRVLLDAGGTASQFCAANPELGCIADAVPRCTALLTLDLISLARAGAKATVETTLRNAARLGDRFGEAVAGALGIVDDSAINCLDNAAEQCANQGPFCRDRILNPVRLAHQSHRRRLIANCLRTQAPTEHASTKRACKKRSTRHAG